MKWLLLFLLICGFSPVYADQLNSFNEIYNSIHQAKNIKMIINFDKCNPSPPVANILVYTAPSSIMIRKNYLQFANSPLTTNNPKYPQKAVLENFTYRITDKNEVNITTRIISLPDYTVINETSSVCPLPTAVQVFN